MINVKQLIAIQSETVKEWHLAPIENNFHGFLGIVCEQHQFNFRLWHEEDKARCPRATDQEIADVKRTIDKLNQCRNDWIEQIDDAIASILYSRQTQASDQARLHTETPGSVIDRLSIIALRIFHLNEQLERAETAPEQRASVSEKLNVCLAQQKELGRSLQMLLNDIFEGQCRHQTFRQNKMYNDANLNPFLYQAEATTSQNAA